MLKPARSWHCSPSFSKGCTSSRLYPGTFSFQADVLTYYDQYVHSAYAAYPLPAVLRVHNYVNLPKSRMRVVLSRTNILIRDKNRCQ